MDWSDLMHDGPPVRAVQSYLGAVYLMNERGDVYRVRFGYDGLPTVEALSFGTAEWPFPVAPSRPDMSE